MGSSCYVIPNDLYSDLMYFSDWQWLCSACLGNPSLPYPFFYLTAYNLRSILVCLFPATPCYPFSFLFSRDMNVDYNSYWKAEQMASFFYVCLDIWGQSILIVAYGKVLGLAKKVGFQPHNYHKEIVFFFCLFIYFFACQCWDPWLCRANMNISMNKSKVNIVGNVCSVMWKFLSI